jgi:hypothetical protein
MTGKIPRLILYDDRSWMMMERSERGMKNSRTKPNRVPHEEFCVGVNERGGGRLIGVRSADDGQQLASFCTGGAAE